MERNNNTIGIDRLCENDARLRTVCKEQRVDCAIQAYGVGSRRTAVLDCLGLARIYSLRVGKTIAPPNDMDRTTWESILDDIVLTRGGDRQCLGCHNPYFTCTGCVCTVGLHPARAALACPNCGDIVSEGTL